MINPLAQELNSSLHGTVPGEMLSDLGLRLFFPKGIIAQGAEAKKLGKLANATIGMAVSNESPLILPTIQKEFLNLTSTEAVAYAQTVGNPEFRALWKEQLIAKNPSLSDKYFSLPAVVPGLTSGISYLCDLFLQEGDVLLAANPSWDNYALIVETRRNASLQQFTLFTESGFNLDAFEKAVKEQAKTGKVRIILNFPQNPSGYTPTESEQVAICKILCDVADKGANVMVWCDDAYFGLNYEDNIAKESLFSFLCDAHEKIFAVKIDGPTKEDFAWGFRIGFLTFGGKDLTEHHYEALNKKLMGTIRSSASCSSSPAQSIMLRAMKNPEIEAEKIKFRKILESRYKKVRAFVDAKKDHAILTALPFNSGYFMCFKCNGITSEDLRLKLLNDYEIGTIAIDDVHLRVAFSSIDDDIITQVYSAIYKAAEELA
ncbi:MAG: aminotransferase class I/II-fold pyridoxal phosphate-dependent enzyme [Treponema sp.]|mgnify:CR=1 FL=1|nr:aminotransferase class I/II-fold pyridoxal phosphate-dependent enzyme [Treponema sp.]